MVLVIQLRVLQHKAVRIVSKAKFSAYTNNLFRQHNFLKLDDIVQLSKTTFSQQFKNKHLPKSSYNFFENIPLAEQVLRDPDFN